MVRWLQDLFLLFFPVNCALCGKKLGSLVGVVCLECEYGMPRTGYGDHPDNPVNLVFRGRIRIECGTSLFMFGKGSAYQFLLHEMKYRGNRKAGHYLGVLLGLELKSTRFSKCDLIIPVPLHRKKLKERGFNQSELIARGVSEILGIPLEKRILTRVGSGGSQTSRGRYERFKNVEREFSLAGCPPDISGTKVLLVDDVVTTGATLEACCRILLEKYNCHLYVATVCIA